jgi:hypothetical protein
MEIVRPVRKQVTSDPTIVESLEIRICANVIVTSVIDYQTVEFEHLAENPGKHTLVLVSRGPFTDSDVEKNVRKTLLRRLLDIPEDPKYARLAHADFQYYDPEKKTWFGTLRVSSNECEFDKETGVLICKIEKTSEEEKIEHPIITINDSLDAAVLIWGGFSDSYLMKTPLFRDLDKIPSLPMIQGSHWMQGAVKKSHEGRLNNYLHHHGHPGKTSSSDIRYAKTQARKTGNRRLMKEAVLAETFAKYRK